MKVVKIVGSIILLTILLFFATALFLKDEINVEKKIIINAPIEQVFSVVNNFKYWKEWSLLQDSSKTFEFSGPEMGVGASMIWHNKKEGVGELKILESKINEKIITELSFQGSESKAKSEFNFKQVNGGVEVTWSMKNSGYSYPFGRYAAWMISKGMNLTFTKGLEKMKLFVETNKNITASAPVDYKIELVKIPSKMLVSITDSCVNSEIGNKMGELYSMLADYLSKNKMECAGFPISIWNSYNPEGKSTFSCAMPIIKELPGDKHIKFSKTPETKVAFVKYFGAYENSYTAWIALEKYIKDNKLEIAGNPWEEYVTDPKIETDTTKWITNIYYPIK